MGKIICEVCGSSYSDTAEQCPFCGYVNPNVSHTAESDNSSSNRNGTYQYVKGGRFSKSNVKKRNQGKVPEVRNTTTEKIAAKRHHSVTTNSHSAPEKHNGNEKRPTGMIVVSVILVLAIIAVVIYLSFQFFGPKHNILPDGTTVPATTTSAEETQQQTMECESVTLNVGNITFDKISASRMLYVKTTPDGVKDTVTFASSNEDVATVSKTGMVTAVGPGESIITATCGKATAQCVVTVNVPEETTEETTVPEETTEPKGVLELNRKDMTFAKKGDTWILYDGNIGKTEIAFTSDDPNVASFEGGIVKAVGKGTTTVHAEYKGIKVSCIVRCNFEDSSGVEGNGGGVSEDVGQSGGSYKIYSQYGSPISDVTIKVGEILQLSLRDASGNGVNTSWRVNGAGLELSGSAVKGIASGKCVVSTTYNGSTYNCTIYIH